jgi:hypothetical protein
MIKVQLYEVIKAYKPKYKTFLVDEIMAANDHMALRLPPFTQISTLQNLSGARDAVGWHK